MLKVVVHLRFTVFPAIKLVHAEHSMRESCD
jgi:hypothetical protein